MLNDSQLSIKQKVFPPSFIFNEYFQMHILSDTWNLYCCLSFLQGTNGTDGIDGTDAAPGTNGTRGATGEKV